MIADEFKGMKAVVVAAAQGVGPAVVDALVAAGARVAVDEPCGGEAVLVEPDAAVAFLDRVEAALGGLDLLVISARPVRNKPVLSIGADEFREVVETDLLAPAFLMQEAGRRMAARGHGRIVVFASMSAKTGAHHNVGPFAAAKGGLLAFVRVMASELAEHGVTVNGIATALFEPQVATMTEERRNTLVKGIPVGRFGRSEEAAHAVLYLASRNSGFVTGECLNLSGGRFMD
ncbi:SDR family NAD(P)-dependent oxidoreductase [Prosthecomicrobium sp. N25]|uniref:SDR family NAD(P)-dependent oxidoreductase n=1 Tax=Prosthecomicrobium sp. N25 TaxID=3129254 RepID=UPI0030779CAB